MLYFASFIQFSERKQYMHIAAMFVAQACCILLALNVKDEP
jgi:hypothetical protein